MPRASQGVGAWLEGRRFQADDFPRERVRSLKHQTVGVIVPTREVAGSVGGVLSVLDDLLDAGVVDEVVVVDAASRDGTAEEAGRHRATVLDENDVLPRFGPTLGKGDAMWRALSHCQTDLVVYLDGDTTDFHEGFVCGLLGPLLADPGIALVKAAYARPFRVDDIVLEHGGGRVTELLARPLINLHRPELGGFEQPLAGEIAARRSLLQRLPFPVGYGVEIAMLLDAAELLGVDALAQVDLGTRQNRHQALHELSAMAYAVLVAASRRVLGDTVVDRLAPGALALPHGGGLSMRTVAVQERPPLERLASGKLLE